MRAQSGMQEQHTSPFGRVVSQLGPCVAAAAGRCVPPAPSAAASAGPALLSTGTAVTLECSTSPSLSRIAVSTDSTARRHCRARAPLPR